MAKKKLESLLDSQVARIIASKEATKPDKKGGPQKSWIAIIQMLMPLIQAWIESCNDDSAVGVAHRVGRFKIVAKRRYAHRLVLKAKDDGTPITYRDAMKLIKAGVKDVRANQKGTVETIMQVRAG